MSLKSAYEQYTLRFKFEAGTSRGTLTRKNIWVIKLWEKGHPDKYGLGEVGPLSGLSPDDGTAYDQILENISAELAHIELPATEEKCLALAASLAGSNHPALRFGLEMALLDLWSGGRRILFPSAFTAGKEEIPINGLIWMGDKAFMRQQVVEKVADDYSCIKMKIGAIDFESELDLLQYLNEAGVEIIRVDANGAFNPDNAMNKLDKLAAFGLHSIEQPIAAGQWEVMRELCKNTPVPIALDEELIGIANDQRGVLLDTIKPQYIILKPTLLGGISATRAWIKAAEEREIGWWITSALESNIGLNAIAQFTAISHYKGHQGLGTGQLYENNFDSPMQIRHGVMHYDTSIPWNLTELSIC